MATVIDGNEIAKTIREELTVTVSEMKTSHGKVPGKCIYSLCAERTDEIEIEVRLKTEVPLDQTHR